MGYTVYTKTGTDAAIAAQAESDSATYLPRSQVVVLTQAAYNALTPDPTVLYFING